MITTEAPSTSKVCELPERVLLGARLGATTMQLSSLLPFSHRACVFAPLVRVVVPGVSSRQTDAHGRDRAYDVVGL